MEAAGRGRAPKLEGAAGYLVVTAVGFAGWALLAEAYPAIVPGPLESLAYLAENAELAAADMANTLVNTVLGFSLALALALVLGGAAAFSKRLKPVIDSFNVVVQSVSALVWAIAFLLIFGFTSRLSSVGVAAATAFPIILSAVLKGFEVARSEYGELIAMFRISPRWAFTHILVPAVVPFLVASGRSAFGAALRISVVAEAFGGFGGVGYRLFQFYELHVYEGFLSWSLLLVALMVAMDRLVLARLEGWSRRWMEA